MIMHLNAHLLFKKRVLPLIQSGQRILEIGPDKVPSSLQGLVDVKGLTWETLDVADRPGITYKATDDYSFPLPDGTFDLVIADQVIEHVKKIWRWVPELARVCKPGGHVVLISPISWPYHEAPVDCWRIYPEGMRALLDESGLECVVALAESIEREQFPELKWYSRTYPGRSCSNMRLSGRLKNIARRLTLKPISYANDLITIARKS
jgi:SAM-dependent methyltransferase